MEQRTSKGHALDPEWIEALADILGGPDAYKEAAWFAKRVPSGYIDHNPLIVVGFDAVHVAALELGGQGQPEQDVAKNSSVSAPPVRRGSTFGGIYSLAVPPQALDDLGHFQLRRYGFSSVELSEMVPVFESFGFKVVEVLPTLFQPVESTEKLIHLDDIRLRWADKTQVNFSIDSEADSQRLIDALNAVDRGRCEVDLLNRLVLGAGLHWQQVEIFRAYRQYRLQISKRFSNEELDEALYAFPSVASALVAIFEAKFDPAISSRDEVISNARNQLIHELSLVSDFDHDQILRGYLELIDATVRTSYYLRDSSGQPLPALVLKLAASRLPGGILSHPLLESFVYSPDLEAVHLRAGLVARGGIRWSERIADFRTEVLGLAQAQIKKNAVIVPTGAKGGFVIRDSLDPGPEEVLDAYKTFIRSLLDITDNLIDGHVVTPGGVVAFDGDDHYLVVAADKGTSSFSDIANAISIENGFWLGDAFASGGTHGYDHKAMRITARGAWIAVRRHFEQLEMDVQNDTIKVVGVGDMSGDVFGNGMLQSQSIALVAAFDHRHIFVDPDPDPLISFRERQRLAGLERSSWNDYDRGVLSLGGGVWSRDSKEIPLHPRVRELLGLSAESLSPPELIAAILEASVDLIWFGGIGTYLKDRDESDADIGDPENDLVRITADKVRARVVAEGANLAVTQKARMRYARRGGRINTDFIDNAAGVAISDREVNLKILLDLAIKEQLMDNQGRNSILAEASDEVANGVLRQVDLSLGAITSAVPLSVSELDAFEALIQELVSSNRLDRTGESLPSSEEFARRRENGAGLIRPELAILLSYSKLDLKSALVDDPLVDDPTLLELAHSYFPGSVTQRFAGLISRHALYRQLIATSLAGEIVDRMGIIWARETSAEFNCTLTEVGGAFWASCKVLGATELWLMAENPDLLPGHQTRFTFNQIVANAVNELARIYLRRGETMNPVSVISRDLAPTAAAASSGKLSSWEVVYNAQPVGLLSDALLTPEMSENLANLAKVPRLVEALEVSRSSGRSLDEVMVAFEEVDLVAHSAALSHLLDDVGANGRWMSWQIRGLRDDLANWRVRACDAALAADLSLSPKDAIHNWQAGQSGNLAQVHRLINDAPKYPKDRITLASLALRVLQNAI
ncbi:MAG: NAD-glutamate dehydrogenase [Actinomycetota bacterium]|nr:MAG: NAD-glutamate dehydrogenase [Actinomycetota bacterium]